MTVIDACLFAGECEMLELRLRTLAPVVDRFVVVACTVTHQGQPANIDEIESAVSNASVAVHSWFATRDVIAPPISFHWIEPSRILERGGRLHERARDDRGPAGTLFFQHIEKQHRDGILTAVKEVTTDPNAMVLCSDVDEIPTPDSIRRADKALRLNKGLWLVFEQRFHSGALDLLHPHQPWSGTCASRLEDCRPQAQRDDRATIGTPNQYRSVPWPDGGVHFSWFGTDAERARKLETFSHAELRGRYDPAEGRRTRTHANGEELRVLTLEDTYGLDWPLPLLDGSFEPPAWWFTEGSRV